MHYEEKNEKINILIVQCHKIMFIVKLASIYYQTMLWFLLYMGPRYVIYVTHFCIMMLHAHAIHTKAPCRHKKILFAKQETNLLPWAHALFAGWISKSNCRLNRLTNFWCSTSQPSAQVKASTKSILIKAQPSQKKIQFCRQIYVKSVHNHQLLEYIWPTWRVASTN